MTYNDTSYARSQKVSSAVASYFMEADQLYVQK